MIKAIKRIILSIESQYHNVPLVSAAVHELCSLIPFGDRDTYAIELCVTEAVVNSIKHAYQDEPDRTVAVIFCLQADELVIKVQDTGKSMDPTLLKVKRDAALKLDTMDTANIPESGRGLAIMQNYMDEVHYRVEENGNFLTMKKKISQLQGDEMISMEMTEARINDIYLLELSGRLDATCSGRLKDTVSTMIDEQKKKILMDLSAVHFIDSSGLGMLVACLRSATKAGGTFKITSLQKGPKKLFEVTRLDRVFEIFDDRDAAIKSF
jgi:anti-anti-sigma factor